MGGSSIALETIMKSCYCAIANTRAGVFHFCSAAPSLCIHKIKVKGDQRIAWRRYILVVYMKVQTLVRMVERPAAFNHCQSVRTEHRYGIFVLSSSPMGYTYHSLTTFLRRHAVPFSANICEGTSLRSLVSCIAYITLC